MSDKKSIVVYLDYRQHLELLSMEERGQLFTAILDYAATGELPILSDKPMMAFSFIRAQIERDTAKYEVICERNRINGAKGGRPPKATPAEDNDDFEAKRRYNMNINTKGNIWRSFTGEETRENIGIECQSEIAKSDGQLVYRMVELFAETLNDEQKDAFWSLCDLMGAVAFDEHERGIAEGLALANKLRGLLENPAAELREYNEDCLGLQICYKSRFENLNAYIKAQGGNL